MNRLADLLRHRVRSLSRAKVHSIAIILTFALGLGANTAMFELIDTILLRPLNFADESRLVSIGTQTRGGSTMPGEGGPQWEVFSNDIAAWQRSVQGLDGIGVFGESRRVVVGDASPEYAVGGSVTVELPRVLGTRPILGRWFTAEEKNTRVVVISRALWTRQFAGESAVLGRRLSIQQEPYVVIGVADEGALLPLSAQYWVPDNTIGGQVVARLRDGMTVTRVAEELTRTAPSIANLKRAKMSRSIVVLPLHDRLFGAIGPILALLMGAAVALLLIACANVASLSLARTLERRRELAIRATLGASRPVLAAIVISENLLLALVGVAAGLLLGAWTTQVAAAYVPEGIRSRLAFGLTRSAMLYGTVVACLAALSVSVAPIALVVDGNVARFLSYSGGRSGRGRVSRRVRQILAAGQLSMSLVFVTSAALLIESIGRLTRIDHLGFNPNGVTVVTLPLWGARFRDGTYGNEVTRRFVERVRAFPATRTVAVGPAPLVGGRGEGLREGFDMVFSYRDTTKRDTPWQTVWLKWVDPGYFTTYGVRVRTGRALSNQDDAPGARVAVINERAARLFFGDRNPIGQSLPMRMFKDSGAARQVVGVIGDELQRDVSIEAAPEILAPAAQRSYAAAMPTIAVRSSDDSRKVVADLQAALRATDPELAAARLEPMTTIVNRSLATHRLLVLMLASFGVLAVLIAVVGVYGLMAYLVAQREHEMGVRLALGAQRSNVLGMVLSEGGRIVATGVIAGLALAAGAGRLIASVAFDVRAADVATFVTVGGVLALAAIAAVFVPARRAANLDPATTLRAE
jgi:predicted permease